MGPRGWCKKMCMCLIRLDVGSTLCCVLVNVDWAYTLFTTDKTLKAFTALYLIYLEEFFSVVHSL